MRIGNATINAYTLVCTKNLWQGESDAIAMFVDFVQRATGYQMPVITDDQPKQEFEIIVGITSRDTAKVSEARASITNDGYAMVLEDNSLFITGSTPRGSVYGMYAFLEEYVGVRYYADTYCVCREDKMNDVPADLYQVDSPYFMSRDVYWHHILTPHNEDRMRYPYALKINRGTMPDLGGGVSYAGKFVHTLADLAEMPHEIGSQPCLTDENVFQTVRKNVRAWLDENPTASIISVSQNDSYAHQMGCQCENCKAIDDREGTPMGSLLTFVNRIADDIREDYPCVYVDTLAYRYTRKAPKTIKPVDNVIVRLCSIECCFCHPLDDPNCSDNREFAKDIEEWSAICNHLYIWDYTTDFMCYLASFPNFAVLRANVNFFKNHNVIGMFEQGNRQSLSGEFGELRGYVLAKLLWNPDMSEEAYQALIDEFLEAYYGDGWRYIREYIDMTSAKAAERHLHIYDMPRKTFTFAEEEHDAEVAFAQKQLELWDKALAAAQDEERRAHVIKSSVQALYYAEFVLPAERFEALNVRMMNAIRQSGITWYRETVQIPHMDEPNVYPDLR